MITPGAVTWTRLASSPLRPEQILDGRPETRSHTFGESLDGHLSFNLWDCTAGRFRWWYHNDEIIQVLEGGAIITPEGGQSRTVEAGDVVYFERGLVADWEVPTYIKKLAVHRSVTRPLLRRVASKLKRLIATGTLRKLVPQLKKLVPNLIPLVFGTITLQGEIVPSTLQLLVIVESTVQLVAQYT